MDITSQGAEYFPLLTMSVGVVLFTLTTVLRHNDHANRVWSAGFAVAAAAVLFSMFWTTDDLRLVDSIFFTTSSVFAVGSIWSGARAFNQRQTYLWVVVFVAVAANLAHAVPTGRESLWLQTIVLMFCAGMFAIAAAVQLRSGSTGKNLNSVIMQVALVTSASCFLIFAGFLANESLGRAENLQNISIEVSNVLIATLFLAGAITFSALRAERYRPWISQDGTEESVRTSTGALSIHQFSTAVADRLDRLSLVGGRATLIVAKVDALPELNLAFGRRTGDEALAHFLHTLRATVPPTALIGYLHSDTFAVFAVSSSTEHANNLVAAISSGLQRARPSSYTGIRLAATFGCADTHGGDRTFEQLLAEAMAKMKPGHDPEQKLGKI